PQQLSTYGKRLTRAVGYHQEVKADLLMVELEAGDRVVLMTDGVWQPLGEQPTFSLLERAEKPGEMLETLHRNAADAGAKDNFSTLILDPPIPPVQVAAGAEQKIKMLGKVPVFEYLSYQDLLKVIGVAELVKVGPDQLLCKEGEPGGEMMLVI